MKIKFVKLKPIRSKKYRIITLIIDIICLFIMAYFDLFKLKYILAYIIIVVALENVWRWKYGEENEN